MSNLQNIKKTIITASVVALVTVLAGCGSNTPPVEEAPHDPYAAGDGDTNSAPMGWKESDGPADFECVGTSGEIFTFSLPVQTPSDLESVQIVDRYRAALGAPEVEYLVLNIDAVQVPTGSQIGVYNLSFATAEFESRELGGATMFLNEHHKNESTEESYAAYQDYMDLGDTTPVPGAKGHYLYVVEEPITSMVNPTIGPGSPCWQFEK